MANWKQRSLSPALIGSAFQNQIVGCAAKATEIGDDCVSLSGTSGQDQCANGDKNPNFTPEVLRAINSYGRPGSMRETA
jgi:hypothetical protein